MDTYELLRSLVPLAAGAVGIPLLLWRIYRWIDVRTREQIEDLEKRVKVLEDELELRRQQRITEVDAERTKRLAAEDETARARGANLSLAEEVRVLRGMLAAPAQ